MIITADTSPICHLILSGCIDILPAIYKKVYIPSQVASELAHKDAPDPVRSFITSPPPWLEIKDAEHLKLLPQLGPGEEAAINLAAELGTSLLMDEKKGRQIANGEPWKVETIGVLGLLEKAADRDLIDLRTALDRLLQSKFHISPRLVQKVVDQHEQQKEKQKPLLDLEGEQIRSRDSDWDKER